MCVCAVLLQLRIRTEIDLGGETPRRATDRITAAAEAVARRSVLADRGVPAYLRGVTIHQTAGCFSVQPRGGRRAAPAAVDLRFSDVGSVAFVVGGLATNNSELCLNMRLLHPLRRVSVLQARPRPDLFLNNGKALVPLNGSSTNSSLSTPPGRDAGNVR